VWFVARLKLVLVLLSGGGEVAEELELTELSHLANYSQPHAPGALLKAAFICTSIVDFPSDQTLSQQLNSKYGCGFRIQSLSNLPVGSGKGFLVRGELFVKSWRCVNGKEWIEFQLGLDEGMSQVESF